MRLRLVLLFCLLAIPASAQTVTATAKWTTADSITFAAGLTYTLKLGTTVVPMGPPTCTGVGTPAVTTCTASLTPPLAPGSYTLTATNGVGSATSDPFIGLAPGKPTISIVVTVTVP